MRLPALILLTAPVAFGQATEAALDRYIEQSLGARERHGPSVGSLYTSQSNAEMRTGRSTETKSTQQQ